MGIDLLQIAVMYFFPQKPYKAVIFNVETIIKNYHKN